METYIFYFCSKSKFQRSNRLSEKNHNSREEKVGYKGHLETSLDV